MNLPGRGGCDTVVWLQDSPLLVPTVQAPVVACSNYFILSVVDPSEIPYLQTGILPTMSYCTAAVCEMRDDSVSCFFNTEEGVIFIGP